jgi:hypothetical protein
MSARHRESRGRHGKNEQGIGPQAHPRPRKAALHAGGTGQDAGQANAPTDQGAFEGDVMGKPRMGTQSPQYDYPTKSNAPKEEKSWAIGRDVIAREDDPKSRTKTMPVANDLTMGKARIINRKKDKGKWPEKEYY